MNTDIKYKIVDALEQYMHDMEMTQSDIAKLSSVNASYIINMRKKEFRIQSGLSMIDIADKYFKRIADLIGFSVEKQYWEVKPTIQLKTILAALEDSKNTGEVSVIIGSTGAGKTFSLDLFKKKYPKEVISVKVGSSDNLNDIIDKIIDNFHMPVAIKTRSAKIKQIIYFLKKMAEDGLDPVLVFDESEYMKQPALCAFKELYDNLNSLCSLVLIGTEQLIENIERMRKRNKGGIPQLYRRIKFKIKHMPSIDRRYTEFLDGLEPGLQRWLRQSCENYGELHDVLVPAKREAELLGKELNEEFVRTILRA